MIKLIQKGDAIFARLDDAEETEEVEVKLIYACPVSARHRKISVFDRNDKTEIAWLETLDELDEESRKVAEQSLQLRYQISEIQSVDHTFVNHGHRYLKVQTDRGFRYFNLKEPGKNVTWLSDDHLLIRDSMGNRYEVPSLAQLDSESREKLDQVL